MGTLQNDNRAVKISTAGSPQLRPVHAVTPSPVLKDSAAE